MTSKPPEADAVPLESADDYAPPTSWVTPRQLIAITALASGLVATYLHLWKLGYMGALTCGSGHGCEVVQMSSWGWFLGVDVALIGAIGYSAILVVSLWGSTPRYEDARWPALALACLVYPAILFTLRLKYAEFVIMKAFCPWCAVSAVTITLHGFLVAIDWRRVSRTTILADGR